YRVMRVTSLVVSLTYTMLKCADEILYFRHTFCRSCISQAITSRPTCPVDRSRLSDVNELKPASKIISNMVNELLVYCPNKDLGCNYQGQRQLLSCHFKEGCMYTIVECCNEECQEAVFKKDLTKHMEKCRAKVIDHEICKCKVQLGTLEGHCDSCPMKHIECPYCYTTIPQSANDTHLEECSERPSTCLHAEYGCSWTGRQRDLLKVHIPSCPYEPLKDFFVIYRQRNEILEQDNKQLRITVQELNKTVTSLQSQLSSISDWLSSMFPSHFLNPEDSVMTSEGPPPLLTTHELLLSENEHFKNDIETLNVALMTESLRTQEEIQNLKNICHSLRMQMYYLLMERRGDEPSVRNVVSTPVARSGLTGSLVSGISGTNGSTVSEADVLTTTIRPPGPNIPSNIQPLRKFGSFDPDSPRQEKL
ncbi:4941_t:CDS:2, partial [Dentiscutata heterogama]